jgi:glycosyltransferase involved in cell wall biosynthesis
LKVSVLSTYPPQRCGIGTYTRELVRPLARLPDTTVELLGEREPGSGDGVDDDRITVRRVWSRDGDWVSDILAAAKQSRPDVLHFQHVPDIFGTDERMGRLFRGLFQAKIRTVVTLHTVHSTGSALIERLWGFRGFMRELGKNADHVVIHQHRKMLELVERDIPRDKITVIPHGSPPVCPLGRRQSRERLGLSPNQPVVACIGFVHIQKNFHTAIAAMRVVRARCPEACLLVAGSILNPILANRAYLALLEREVVALGLRGSVRVINRFLEEADMVAYFDAADIVLFPYWQGYGSSSGLLHMAMAVGSPVLCSRSPKFAEVAELLGDEVILPTFGTTAWGDTITELLLAPERRAQMSEKLRTHAEETSWQRVAEQTRGVYGRVVQLGSFATA